MDHTKIKEHQKYKGNFRSEISESDVECPALDDQTWIQSSLIAVLLEQLSQQRFLVTS